MKYALVLATMLVAMVAVKGYADDGAVSRAMLAEMGLASLEPMSDVQAAKVRGQGFSWALSVSASELEEGTGAFSPAFATGNFFAEAISGAQSSVVETDLTIEDGIPSGTISSITVGSIGFARARSF